MYNVKLLNRALWGFNVLLGAGIVFFAFQYLILSQDARYLKDFRPDEDAGPSTPVARQDLGDGALKSITNPLEKRKDDGAKAPSALRASLKGTLPGDKDKRQGVAFLKATSKNTELVAFVGEAILHDGKPFDEFRGWTLVEVSKDKASFKCTDGQTAELTVDQTMAAVPGAPGAPGAPGGGPGRVNRVGTAYTSEQFKSRLLASADSRQVWGMDQEEIDWAAQNLERIMDQDFQVAPYAGGGLRVENVQAGTIGASRGVMAGDIIREINGQPLSNIQDIRTLMNNPSMKQQTGLRFTLERAGKPIVLEYRPLPR